MLGVQTNAVCTNICISKNTTLYNNIPYTVLILPIYGSYKEGMPFKVAGILVLS